MSIIAKFGLWSVLVSNSVVYNSIVYKMPWAAEPWVMAQPKMSL